MKKPNERVVQYRRIFGAIAVMIGLMVCICTALLLLDPLLFSDSAFHYQVGSQLRIRYVVMLFNILFFCSGLAVMSIFKTNIDTELRTRGRLEKHIMAAYLLTDLGYENAQEFVEYHLEAPASEHDDSVKKRSPPLKRVEGGKS